MIKQSDIEGRLNLFRYGVIVVTITAFVVSIAAPMALTSDFGEAGLGIGELMMPSIIITAITAVIGVVAYFAYAQLLKRFVGGGDTASE